MTKMQASFYIVKFCSRLKGLRRDAGWHTGLHQSLFKKKGGRILVYHGICQGDPLHFNTLFIRLKTFEKQLRLYKKYFNIISLNDFYKQRFSDEKFSICLTFDDGFASNYKYVLPLLEQYQIPATFFLTGIRQAGYDILWNDVLAIAAKYGPSKISFQNEVFIKNSHGKYISFLDDKPLVEKLRSTEFESKAALIEILGHLKNKVDEDYWLQMTEDQIKKLSESKWVSIGSHGHYHNDLAKISDVSAKEELSLSKRFLENIIGREIRALAFPYGSYTREVIEQAKQANYQQLLATEFLFPEDTCDAMLRERFTINPFISTINQLHANVSGKYK